MSTPVLHNPYPVREPQWGLVHWLCAACPGAAFLGPEDHNQQLAERAA